VCHEKYKSPKNPVLPRTSGHLLLFPLCFKGTAYKTKCCNIKAFGNVSKQINCIVKNKKCNKSAIAPNQISV
jgi:hypothetical protein